MLAGNAEERLLNHLLVCCQEHKWLKAASKQRTDSTHVLARIRATNRLECVIETMRFTLKSLSKLVPDWLAGQLQPEWANRYGPRADEYRLPETKAKRLAYAQQIGQDGLWLMERIELDKQATHFWQLPAVDILGRVWIQQFRVVDGQLIWRVENQNQLPPSAQIISAAYDLEARFSRKRATTWVGYKVHLSETCEDDRPHLITQVATTISPDGDSDTLPHRGSDSNSSGIGGEVFTAVSALSRYRLYERGYASTEPGYLSSGFRGTRSQRPEMAGHGGRGICGCRF